LLYQNFWAWSYRIIINTRWERSGSGEDHSIYKRGTVRSRVASNCCDLLSSRVSVTRKRNLAKRSDEKPFRIESSSSGKFRTWVNRSYQRVKGCYCASARACDSGGLGNEVSQAKDAERRYRERTRTGEDTGSRQGPWKPSEESAILKTVSLTCERNATWELRGETRGFGQTHC
jgi:hypothetical protein